MQKTYFADIFKLFI